MTEPSHCALQVVRIAGAHSNANDGRLYVKIKLGESIRKTCEIDDDGKPSWHDTFTFVRMDASTAFNISLRKPRRLLGDELVGRADIMVAQLLEGSAEHEFRLTLQSSSRMRLGRTDHAAIVLLSFREIDALSRATIDVKAAERSVERITNSGETSESAISVIGSVKEVVDIVVEAVDKVAEIHPLFQVSWKAASALYKLVSHQYETDEKLVGMVAQMSNAHDFTSVAKGVKDDGNVIKPKVKELLDETSKCSQFVQEYVKYNFAVRMARIRDRERINGFSERFVSLRGELDSVIGAATAKVADEIREQQKVNTQVISKTSDAVVDIKLRQQLEYHLSPLKSDASSVSKRPRCLDGTREEYLGPIIDFLSSDGTPNVHWLTGAAGSGKSTIAVTTADRCSERGWNVAYIFFERGKSDPYSVIRTIAYELSMLHPPFASHVAKAISEKKKIVGNTLKTQFEELLLGPLNNTMSEETGHIVIILDALDECGSVDERRDLLLLLKDDFTRLPSKVRILVTSRPEGDIMEDQASGRHIKFVPLNHDSEKGRADVGEYIKKEMLEAVKGKAPNGREWEDIFRLLTEAAGGLFIWASTAVKIVRGRRFDPSKRLGELLDDIRTVGNHGIDSLYATAIKESGISRDDPDASGMFTQVVGLVVGTKEAMSANVIASFLGVEESSVDNLLSRLQSVLFYESGQPIRPHHASFADYLLSAERSGGRSWHVDEAGQRLAIAERCLDTMTEMLHFNICGIESSFVYNRDISDLQERIRENVPPHLDYACRFWATHVCELPNSTDLTSLLAKLKTFAETHFLYWFEVLSLTGNFSRVAIRALLEVTLWAAPADRDLSSFIWAAYRLASVFSFPISQSAPQVYLSTMSLWRGESRVADLYSRTHPCVPVHRYGSKPPAQCIKVIVGHKKGINSVAFSPDGKRIVSGSDDNTICIWDADTGELVLGPLTGHKGGVSSVAFSRDGKRVVSGSLDKTIRIWNAVTGELVSGPLEGHTGPVNSVAFSPDGTRLASGSGDGTVRIWDVNTGKFVAGPFEGHTGLVNSVGFSPDGSRVVSGSFDGTIRVWNVDSGDAITFEGHTRPVTSVAFSPDGSRIVSGSFDMTIRVWNAETGELVSGPFKGHGGVVWSVAFSPDGNLVVFGSVDTTVRIWDSNTGKLVSGPFEGHTSRVRSVAFSPDGKRAVSGSEDTTIRIWDVDSGVVHSNPLNRHESSMNAVGFSADGKRTVSGFANGKIRVWDTDSGKLVSDAFEGHTYQVHSVALSADGTLVVSASNEGKVRVWNASSGELVSGPLKDHTRWIRSVAFSRDGNRVVSASVHDQTIRIWNAVSGELVSGPLVGHTNWVSSVTFSPDGSLVVSGSDDATIRLWNALNGAPVFRPFQKHESAVASVAFSLNGEKIVSGSADGTIRIFDAATGELVLGPLRRHIGWVNSVAFSGNRVVSGSDDRTIRVWNAVSGKSIFTFYGHGDRVLSVAFSPDERFVYSGSKDGTIRTWYVGDGEAMHEHVLEHSGDSLSVVLGAAPTADRVVEVPSSDLTKRRAIRDWKMTEDGWIVTGKGELLTWIPEDMRTSVWQGRNTAFFGWRFLTRLDFSDAPVGEGWYRGFPRLD